MYQSEREHRGGGAGRSAAVLALGLLGGAAGAAAMPAATQAVAQPAAMQAIAPPAAAQPAPDLYEEAVEGRTVQDGPVSLREARAMAAERFEGGRVVSAETKVHKGNRVHEIRVIDDDNRVRTVRIDVRSGEFL